MQKDYYSILGIKRDASESEIRQTFRKLAHKYHPDKKGGDEKKFKEINEAYQVLSDAKKRQQYDAFGTTGQRGGGNYSGGFEDIFTNGGGGFSANFNADDGMGGIFHKIFRTMRARGRDINIDTTISFKESVYGTQKEMLIPYRRKTAEKISFTIPPGVESGMQIQVSGRGEPPEEQGLPSGDLIIRMTVTPHAHFRKQQGELLYTLDLRFTEAILGTQKQIQDVQENNLTVTVPKGSKDGTIISLDGHGIPQPHGTGRLLIVCRVTFPTNTSSKVKEAFAILEKEGW